MTSTPCEDRRIGRLTVSVAGLGCNNFGTRLDRAGTTAVVDAALEAGITFFDTADYYGNGSSEELLGSALARRRDRIVIATKFGKLTPVAGLSGGDPRWVVRACDDSLRRLGTDVIDLYLMHAPDPATPIGETLAALNGLMEAGKVREIGCSNFSVEQLMEAVWVARARDLRGFACVQDEYSLLRRDAERELLPVCLRLGLAFIPYFPLASGLLSGKYRRGEAAPAGSRLGGADGRPLAEAVEVADIDRAEALRRAAESHGHTLLELALSWLAARPQVASVIAGATRPQQVRANVAATGAWELTDEELVEVDRLTLGR
jgi:aryl-alcohol dehydrogenase-like predicted oxidoreductase